MPGFGPAAEALLFRQKDPKPLTPSSAKSNRADAGDGGEPTRYAQTRPANNLEASTHGAEQQASVREGGISWVRSSNHGIHFRLHSTIPKGDLYRGIARPDNHLEGSSPGRYSWETGQVSFNLSNPRRSHDEIVRRH